MPSGRKPDRGSCVVAGAASVLEPTRRDPALQLVHLERDLNVEAVPVDDAVREDLPLRDAALDAGLELRELLRPVVHADPVDAGVEPRDVEAVDQHTVDE